MSRSCIIFHGTGGNPEILWFPWRRDRLIARGYAVESPYYPEINVEPIASLLPKVLANHTFDVDTVLAGHSGGAALLPGLLQNIHVTVSRAILVAGYSTRTRNRSCSQATSGRRSRQVSGICTSSTPARILTVATNTKVVRCSSA